MGLYLGWETDHRDFYRHIRGINHSFQKRK